jgi:nucleoside-diphosphate-sugar epimerase
MWVVVARAALHTGHMTGATAVTTFVTGAAGFIGTALVRVLLARGHEVYGLTRSAQSAQHLRRLGAVPVAGDLLEPGKWQDVAGAEWVFHVPPHVTFPRRLSRNAAAAMARNRALMDAHLLDALGARATRRIVYVADAGAYGATGPRPITEDAPTRPSARGQYLAPALDRLDGYIASGLPIVMAHPGWVYGNGSWFRERVVEPVMAGRPVLQVGAASPWVSPIHVEDCARALVHLAEHGKAGGRYFLVNSEPIRLHQFAATFARLANRPLRVRRVPAMVARLAVGSAVTEHFSADAAFSNIRLRGTGFRFMYPTLEEGLQQVLGALHE